MKKKKENKLGEIIKNARESKGLSQRQLAKLSNIDNAEVSRIESGKRQKPNVLSLKGIANALNLSLVELMKVAGYDDIDINWGRTISEKRSIRDYQKSLKDYERFYFYALDEIQKRRTNALECKNIYVELIDRIENPQFYSKEITMEEILLQLKEVSRIMRPNLDKLDKSKYPKFDRALFEPLSEEEK